MLASTLIRQTARSIIRPTEIARQVHRQALPIFTPRCPSAVRHVDRLRWTRESSAKPRPTARGGMEQLLEVSRTSGSRQTSQVLGCQAAALVWWSQAVCSS
jgi:hypothetical protein